MWKLHYEYHYRVLDIYYIWLPNHLVEKVAIEAHKWQRIKPYTQLFALQEIKDYLGKKQYGDADILESIQPAQSISSNQRICSVESLRNNKSFLGDPLRNFTHLQDVSKRVIAGEVRNWLRWCVTKAICGLVVLRYSNFLTSLL